MLVDGIKAPGATHRGPSQWVAQPQTDCRSVVGRQRELFAL